jgi:HEAT repeat protein
MDPAVTRRREAIALAGHSGDAHAALDALTDDAAIVRATALGALARLGVLTDDQLRGALTDTDPVVRRRATELAATRFEVPLDAVLNDLDADVLEMAAWACGEREEQAGADSIARLVVLSGEHRDPLVREAAVAALGAIGDETALPTLLAALRDKPAIRRRAVIALSPFDRPEVQQALEAAKADRDWQVRQLAEDLAD